MKKLASVLAVGLALSSAAAMASDGSVNISGELTASTCTVSSNTGSNIINLILPKLSTTTLKTLGDVGGTSKFTIMLTNCTVGATVKPYFENSPNVATDGNLKNTYSGTGTAATNVEVRLLNGKGTPIDLNQPFTTQDTGTNGTAGFTITTTNTGANFDYFAQYYALAQTTAGMVQSSITYSIQYN